jgi:transposase InsO family protein
LFESKKEIFKFIDTERENYPLGLLCRVYDVSRFGYHSWKKRGMSARESEDIELTVSIERVFGEVDGIYASPKIHEALKKEGISVGLNRVARLMRENDMKARCSRIYRNHSGKDRFHASIRNEINELEATGPDQIWVGDVTYLRVNDEWRYLAVIVDLFSRKVVGWSRSKRRNVDLSLAAFKTAAKKRLLRPGLYFHSDRGAEYVAGKYQRRLEEHGVIQGMNRKGVMNDNAEMASFFHQFKAERIHRNEYMTERELRAAIIEYVGFYNKRRLHSSLGYLSPVDYEVRMA